MLNTFLRLGTPEVARTVFHELAHRIIRADDSLFTNPSPRRWKTKACGAGWPVLATPANVPRSEAQRQRKAAFAGLMRDFRKKFHAPYETDRSAADQRQAKADLPFERCGRITRDSRRAGAAMPVTTGSLPRISTMPTLPSLALYGELPAFERLLEIEDREPAALLPASSRCRLGGEARCARSDQLLPASGESRRACHSLAAGATQELSDR
ncbi:MAG: aminopeptidase [Sulfuritalea sp.]|nr:aminopeptidase [Sulfuritalea sp.]